MSVIKQYRKKPVVIEAVQWDGYNVQEIIAFIGDTMANFFASGKMKILTLEGNMTANAGDYVIKGVQGEFYPCKPEIFAETYELVGEEQ